jgi:NADH-quinone oxidoreductase subunit H
MIARCSSYSPNAVGIFGIMIPLADGLKLLTKESIVPTDAQAKLFTIAPQYAFVLAITSFAIVPIRDGGSVAHLELGGLLLLLLGISSLSVYSMIIAGWTSNSKYAFIGAIRSASQMVSYELTLGVVVITIAILAGSINRSVIVYSQVRGGFYILSLFPRFRMFRVVVLAEFNRHPFDLP